MHTSPEENQKPSWAETLYDLRGVSYFLAVLFLVEPLVYAAIPLVSPVPLLSMGWPGLLLMPGVLPACLAFLCALWMFAENTTEEYQRLLIACALNASWFWYRLALILCLAGVCLLGYVLPWTGVWLVLVNLANAAAVFVIIAGTRAIINKAEEL